MLLLRLIDTYDHRIMKTRLPVRSALFKHDTGGLVVKWVTISESLLLYVFDILLLLTFSPRSAHGVLLQGVFGTLASFSNELRAPCILMQVAEGIKADIFWCDRPGEGDDGGYEIVDTPSAECMLQ
jgi:hypothetical protein